MFWKKQKHISTLISRSDIRTHIKRARILVIDDDPIAFPTQLLQEEGYNITYWDCVRTLQPLESGEYDLIVLDLNDIALPTLSAADGIGILRHIKTYNPGQIVIAYSAKKYDFKQSDFWKIADDFLGKPSPLDACKQKIDELLLAKFNILHYWETIKKTLEHAGVSQRKIKQLEDTIVKKAEDGGSLNTAEITQILKIGKDSLGAISTLIGIIFKIYKDA